MAGWQQYQNKKGRHAQFLRENPKYINEPICNLVVSSSADDPIGGAAVCMRWPSESETNTRKHISYSQDTTNRIDYKPHPSSGARGVCGQPLSRIKEILDPSTTHKQQLEKTVRERISFKHQYDSRADPNEPLRGKLHGAFICELVHEKIADRP